MKWGKFEINDGLIAAVFIAIILFIVLHYTLAEERLKEETKQLELKKEIILLEKGENQNEN